MFSVILNPPRSPSELLDGPLAERRYFESDLFTAPIRCYVFDHSGKQLFSFSPDCSGSTVGGLELDAAEELCRIEYEYVNRPLENRGFSYFQNHLYFKTR